LRERTCNIFFRYKKKDEKKDVKKINLATRQSKGVGNDAHNGQKEGREGFKTGP
jgi:hypothetical protein